MPITMVNTKNGFMTNKLFLLLVKVTSVGMIVGKMDHGKSGHGMFNHGKMVYIKAKSNLTAGAVQVEANLQEELSVHLPLQKAKMLLEHQVIKVISHVSLDLTVSDFKLFTLKKQVKIIKCKVRNGIICWQISKSLKVVPCI